ncbi:MAG: cytochrome c3 family protein [Bacteroidia bacterium]
MKRWVVLLILVALVSLSVFYPHRMLNPGELSLGHQKIKNECTACHQPFSGIDNSRCIGCHQVEKIGMKPVTPGKKLILFHDKLKAAKCVDCHSDHKGIQPLSAYSGFEHNLLPAGVKNECNGCHVKPEDKLHSRVLISCNSCHTTNTWKPENGFNHEVLGKSVVADCAACHDKPNDDLHVSLQGNCGKCHATAEWSPSTFDHSLFFILDKDHNAKCTTCHTNQDFKVYTCYGCHEHAESKIRSEHQEEGIYNFSDCASCHRSGNEHDIRKGRGGNMESGESAKVKEYIKSGEKHSGKDEKDDD